MSKMTIDPALHADVPLPEPGGGDTPLFAPDEPLRIGTFELKHRVLPAPMCGISDRPTRTIAREMGCDLVYTQMFSSEGIIRDDRKTWGMIDIADEPENEGPVAVQLFGGRPEALGESARRIADEGVALIDLNMGCPARKVTGNHCGSALMKDPPRVKAIIAEMRQGAPDIPVTAKFRAGWDDGSKNLIEIGRICQEEGADAVALHPRTREQKFTGRSEWDLIGELKSALDIPVIGNGDVNSGEDALRMVNLTGCDAVMLGRGWLGNPWALKECLEALHYPERFAEYMEQPVLEERVGAKSPRITLEDRLRMLLKHGELMAQWKGEPRGMVELRKHGVQYVKGLKRAREFKKGFLQLTTLQELRDLVARMLDELQRQPEAMTTAEAPAT